MILISDSSTRTKNYVSINHRRQAIEWNEWMTNFKKKQKAVKLYLLLADKSVWKQKLGTVNSVQKNYRSSQHAFIVDRHQRIINRQLFPISKRVWTPYCLHWHTQKANGFDWARKRKIPSTCRPTGVIWVMWSNPLSVYVINITIPTTKSKIRIFQNREFYSHLEYNGFSFQ